MKYTIINTEIRYTELPPKWKVIYEDNSPSGRVNRYLSQTDAMIAGPDSQSPGMNDIVSLIFDQQARSKEQQSRHLASLIEDRCTLARKHIDDINFRIDDLWEQKPFRPRTLGPEPEGNLSDAEKAIANLEKEKRETETSVWRDVIELRRDFLTDRQEYKATTRRMSILTGSRLTGGDDHAP